VSHFAPHTSLGASFTPLFAGALREATPSQPAGLSAGDPRGVFRTIPRGVRAHRQQQQRRRPDRTSLYWAFRYVV
mgnify:CR=1